MKLLSIIVIVVILVGISVLGGTFFIVDETQQGIITQFGKPVGEAVTTPGLHMKVPFIQNANYFDKRYMAWDGAPNQIPTKDKRFIWVDTYARWRISEPLLFFQRLRDERRAQSRLKDILDGETRNAIAKHKLIDLVRSTNREAVQTQDDIRHKTPLKQIKFGREKLEKEVLEAASGRTVDLGMEILDFKFKRINYVEDVRKEVYARMISERVRIAEQYRSEGAGEAAKIAGEKDRDLKKITSEAYRNAKEIRGDADAKASDIYAKAYKKDPDFYRFIRTMDSYAKVMGNDSTLVISTDNDLLKYLNGMK